jgi:hypothetical protein
VSQGDRWGVCPTSATPRHPPPQHWPPQRQDPPIPPTPSPTYERLPDSIARRMRMSHVYQPLMLMELLQRLRQEAHFRERHPMPSWLRTSSQPRAASGLLR